MRVVKPNLGPHIGRANNPMSFDEAYTHVLANPSLTYHTTGIKAAFIVAATCGKRGKHANERVLRFMSDKKERARAYHCCWGHVTNCNSTHIDIYSEEIQRANSALQTTTHKQGSG